MARRSSARATRGPDAAATALSGTSLGGGGVWKGSSDVGLIIAYCNYFVNGWSEWNARVPADRRLDPGAAGLLTRERRLGS